MPPIKKNYYLISACLLGINCRYDGSSALQPQLKNQLKNKSLLIVCPEKLGKLSTPRLPVQIVGIKPGKTPARYPSIPCGYDGKSIWNKKACLLSRDGRNFTPAFIKGSKQVAQLLKVISVKCAFLKDTSPSCGYGQIYNRAKQPGDTILVKGDGILTALLKQEGIAIKPC